MTWDETNKELKLISHRFCELHEIGEKNFSEEQQVEMVQLRKRCIDLNNIRIGICLDRLKMEKTVNSIAEKHIVEMKTIYRKIINR